MKDHLVYYDEVVKLNEKFNSFLNYEPDVSEIKPFFERNFQFIRDEQYNFFGRKIDEFEQLWEELNEDEKHELARPLSARQLFCAERVMNANDDDIYRRLWDFLQDDGAIARKKIMSMAEVAFFAMLLERVYAYLG